jgi:hypothetical protein
MNAESSILTGIVTGVLTGGITGYLAALYAIRQFKAQRAFDRQLEWYERTVRALGAISQIRLQATHAQHSETHVFDELRKGLLDLNQCVNEAVLYAEQSSYEQLKAMRVKCNDDMDQEKVAKAFEKVMQETSIELSKPVRKMLGLKKFRNFSSG